MGAARGPKSSVNTVLFFEVSLLEARCKRQDVALKPPKHLREATKNPRIHPFVAAECGFSKMKALIARGRGSESGGLGRGDGRGAICGHASGCPRLLRALRLPPARSTVMTDAVSNVSYSSHSKFLELFLHNLLQGGGFITQSVEIVWP